MALLLGGMTSVVATVTIGGQPSLESQRNFYGILRVTEHKDQNGPRRELRHGHVLHGLQFLEEPKRAWATTYYGPHSGVALALNAFDRPNRRVAVIGLGAGTMAAWGRAGDTFRFYDIDPDVAGIAQTWFSFLKDSKARTEIVLGDARVQLESELSSGHSKDFDVIAVDAFSGDAIPLHLLTAECARIYQRRRPRAACCCSTSPTASSTCSLLLKDWGRRWAGRPLYSALCRTDKQPRAPRTGFWSPPMTVS